MLYNIIHNEYKQRQTKYSFFHFSNEASNEIDRSMLENARASNSRVFRGVLSKFPKLKTSIFSNSWTAIYPLDKSYPLFEQLVPEL